VPSGADPHWRRSRGPCTDGSSWRVLGGPILLSSRLQPAISVGRPSGQHFRRHQQQDGSYDRVRILQLVASGAAAKRNIKSAQAGAQTKAHDPASSGCNAPRPRKAGVDGAAATRPGRPRSRRPDAGAALRASEETEHPRPVEDGQVGSRPRIARIVRGHTLEC